MLILSSFSFLCVFAVTFMNNPVVMPKKTVITVLICFFMGNSIRIGASAAQPLPAYAIAVDAVMQRLQEQQDLFLVDVREERQFVQVRIPGSLNIPLFAVKTKAFLKTKPVVLIDEGYRPHHLEETCVQLTQAGFEAHFLFGGLNAWRAWSAKFNLPPLQGDVFAQKALNTMPPRALFAERGGEYWLLIDVSASEGTQPQPLPGRQWSDGEDTPLHPPQGGNTRSRPPSTGLRTGLPNNAVDVSPGSAGVSPASDADRMSAFPGAGETPALPGGLPEGDFFSQAISVPFDRDNPEPFLTHVEYAVADAAVRSELFLVLIYNQHGEDYEQIERVLRNADIAPVFFLQGGSDAYQKFSAQQNQIRQGGEQDLTTPCKPCGR